MTPRHSPTSTPRHVGNRRRQRGFILLFVLLLCVGLIGILSAGLQAQHALRTQNRRELKALQSKADALHLHLVADPVRAATPQ